MSPLHDEMKAMEACLYRGEGKTPVTTTCPESLWKAKVVDEKYNKNKNIFSRRITP